MAKKKVEFAAPEIGARIFMTTEEMRLLHRVLVSGIVGGRVEVRKSLEGKIGRALKAIAEQEGIEINGEVSDNKPGRVPSRALLEVEGRAD